MECGNTWEDMTVETHHVAQVVHPQLVGVHAQCCLLVVGFNHSHVLIPDGSADLFFTLRQTKVQQSSAISFQLTLMGFIRRS